MWSERVSFDGWMGCWTWTGPQNGVGYGRTSLGGQMVYIHRYVYEELVGPIPEGLQLDHTCRNRACCNPWHLELVTSAENTRRGINAIKTHCVNGHRYTPENTKLSHGKWRSCRRCANADDRKYRESRRA